MDFFLALLFVSFLVGLLFGSFLNVCISRVPAGQSVVRPRSRCPECGAGIRWFDNVPLVSWVVLRARCRDCGGKISWRYPAVEAAVGLWFGVAVLELKGWRGSQLFCWRLPTFGESSEAGIASLGFAILGFLLIGLIVIDWNTLRLPDEFTLGGIAMGLFLVCSQAIFLGPGEDQIVLSSSHQLRLSSPGSFAARGNVFLTGPESLIFGRVAAVCGAALLLLIVRWTYRALRKRDGLGLGDVKMLAMIAAFLGFWPAVVALFVGVMGAAVYGTALMARGKAHALTRLPLGSFLGVGGLVAAVWGDQIVVWYRGLLG
jgi:leader peptidase (prepilin peptidase)/N-methyltransferase